MELTMATSSTPARECGFCDEKLTPEQEAELHARMRKMDEDLKVLHERADRLLADLERDRAWFAKNRGR
jgi:hypothetical protein